MNLPPELNCTSVNAHFQDVVLGGKVRIRRTERQSDLKYASVITFRDVVLTKKLSVSGRSLGGWGLPMSACTWCSLNPLTIVWDVYAMIVGCLRQVRFSTPGSTSPLSFPWIHQSALLPLDPPVCSPSPGSTSPLSFPYRIPPRIVFNAAFPLSTVKSFATGTSLAP